jgi:LAO/AO transport system kinase
MAKRLKIKEYVEGILNQNITILSQAISLVESKKQEDESLAEKLIQEVLPYTGKSKRIGITGSPGVGKSTFIDIYGQIIAREFSLAVLTVDPSSPISKGSILGDKTRMFTLSQLKNVYIRSTASGNAWGGVARASYETLLLCEAAGFEVIIIESVGVGQSETLIHHLVDCFMLLILGNSGDELQGIKKGIMEMADIIVITKADEKNRLQAKQSQLEFQNALKFFHHPLELWNVPVEICSALENYNISKVWDTTKMFFNFLEQHNILEKMRTEKSLKWFYHELNQMIFSFILRNPNFQNEIKNIENQISNKKIMHFEGLKKMHQWLTAFFKIKN